jgi:biopolymer transport protein ExbD
MHKFGQRQIKEAEELNITAFMNLMVILVPFLLITAVFSRMTVLELSLPDPNSANSQEPITLSLELVVRQNSFDIQDGKLGLIKRIERTQDKAGWDRFRDILVEIKRRFPDERSITLLLEPSIDYKTLIKTMDTVSSAQIAQGLSVETVELFPDISIGDAAVAATQNSAGTKADGSQ